MKPLVASLALLLSLTGEAVAEPAEPLRVGLEVVGPSPLPWQAVRLGVWVENRSTRSVGPLEPVEDRCHLLVRCPGDAGFRLIADALVLPESAGGDPAMAERRRANLRRPRYLEAGKAQYASFVLVASWRRGEAGTRPEPQPVFPVAGIYHLKWIYREGDGTRPPVEAVLRLTVVEATGTDREALGRLRDDPALLAVLLHPRTEPTPEEVERLQALVDAHPRSSYAAYAHFALGRHYLRERRAGKRAWRVHEALADDHLSQARWQVTHLPEANELLRQWQLVTFPYEPDVVRRRIRAGSHGIHDVEGELRNRFPDDVGWLFVEAGRMGGAEWDAYRAEVPARKRPSVAPLVPPRDNVPREHPPPP